MSDPLAARKKAALRSKWALEDLLEALGWPADERALSLALDRIDQLLAETS